MVSFIAIIRFNCNFAVHEPNLNTDTVKLFVVSQFLCQFDDALLSAVICNDTCPFRFWRKTALVRSSPFSLPFILSPSTITDYSNNNIPHSSL